MKNRKIRTALFTGIAVMLLAAGCGSEAETVMPEVEKIPEISDNAGEENPGAETEGKLNQENADVGETSDPEKEPETDEEFLMGYVRSIEGNRGVISKTFLDDYDQEEGYYQVAVSPAEGSEEEVLITVEFAENATYTIREIRDNGELVSEKPGSITDIEEGTDLSMTGFYEGDVFKTDSVIIVHITS